MFLAWRELKRFKLRYTLLHLIIIAILFLLFFITGLANGLSFADSSSLQNLKADHLILNKEAEGALINSALTEEQIEKIKKELNQGYSPLALTISQLNGEQSKATDIIYFSIDTKKYPNLEIVEGKNISELTGNEIVISESMKKDGFELNDEIIDKNSNKKMTIAGFTKGQTYSFLPVIYADLDLEMNKIYSEKASYNAVLYSGTEVTMKDFDTLTKEEIVKSMPGYTETQGSFTVMKVFMFIISAFVSTVFFYVITIQKTAQFGVLKAIGATTKYIAKNLIAQVSFITFTSLLISGVSVYGIVQILPDGIPFKMSFSLFLSTGVVFLLLNILGSLLSVFTISRIDPLTAIGRAE